MTKRVSTVDWTKALAPLFRAYGKRKHPLEYKNRYQLLAVVVLSSRSTDALINKISPPFFKAFPTIKKLAKAKPEDLFPYVHGVTNFRHKSEWLVSIAKIVGDDADIPTTMEELTKLPGIGRKSANVIISESGGKSEGVIVDLHVVRVAPRIGIAKGTDPGEIEVRIMERLPQKYWRLAGMGMTFLGREVCRPTSPRCTECVVNSVCEYYKKIG
jgi:endonuclease-3